MYHASAWRGCERSILRPELRHRRDAGRQPDRVFPHEWPVPCRAAKRRKATVIARPLRAPQAYYIAEAFRCLSYRLERHWRHPAKVDHGQFVAGKGTVAQDVTVGSDRSDCALRQRDLSVRPVGQQMLSVERHSDRAALRRTEVHGRRVSRWPRLVKYLAVPFPARKSLHIRFP